MQFLFHPSLAIIAKQKNRRPVRGHDVVRTSTDRVKMIIIIKYYNGDYCGKFNSFKIV